MSSGGMSSALGKLDPLGNKITQWGGDPLNLYGNQNNPSAALFPSGMPAPATPSVLPAPNGNVTPITYNPNSFVPRQPAGPGAYNAMVAQLAGPAYRPQIQNLPPPPPSLPLPLPLPGIPGISPAVHTALTGTTLAQLLAQRPDGAMAMPYNPKYGPTRYAR